MFNKSPRSGYLLALGRTGCRLAELKRQFCLFFSATLIFHAYFVGTLWIDCVFVAGERFLVALDRGVVYE